VPARRSLGEGPSSKENGRGGTNSEVVEKPAKVGNGQGVIRRKAYQSSLDAPRSEPERLRPIFEEKKTSRRAMFEFLEKNGLILPARGWKRTGKLKERSQGKTRKRDAIPSTGNKLGEIAKRATKDKTWGKHLRV